MFFLCLSEIWNLSKAAGNRIYDNAKIIRNPYNVSYDAAPPWPLDEEGVLKLAILLGRLDSKDKIYCSKVLRSEKMERPIEVTLLRDGYRRNCLKRLKDLWA